MNPEQQRIELAKLDGWSPDDGWNRTWTHKNGPAGVAIPTEHLPDYLKDLDAVHELEGKLFLLGTAKKTIHATNAYTEHLCRVIGCLDTALFQFAHATAAQRSEAILRVKGIWK